MNKTLKKKLSENRLTIGSWITIPDPSVAEIMAKSGFDWLTIDMEHSAIDLPQAQNLIRIIDLYGLPALVRVGENNPNLIKRIMDAGADGVIVPMVNTKDDLIQAVNAVKYPPSGTRGVGLARAQGYGYKFDEYKEWLKNDSLVIAQIEHIDAIRNLDDILRVEELDGVFIGPYDLSASMGKPGDLGCKEMIATLNTIKTTAEKFGVPVGFHAVKPDTETLTSKIKEGYKMLAFSFDALMLSSICRDSIVKINQSIRKV